MFGVRSADGVVTQAPSHAKAKEWAEYKFSTVLGPVGEELVCFNGKDWVNCDG